MVTLGCKAVAQLKSTTEFTFFHYSVSYILLSGQKQAYMPEITKIYNLLLEEQKQQITLETAEKFTVRNKANSNSL